MKERKYTVDLTISKVFRFRVNASNSSEALDKCRLVADRRKNDPEGEKIEGEISMNELSDRERNVWSIVSPIGRSLS
jgi:hypothetical protein